jgi:DNA polymerase-3 subunit delta
VKLNSQQLIPHLSSGVLPVYLVSGDEPLLVNETLDLIRSHASQQEFLERDLHVVERSFDWDALRGGLQNFSLFATRRIVEIRLPTGKPGKEGARVLTEFAGDPIKDTVIIVVTPKLDSRSANAKWVNALAKGGAWIILQSPNQAAMPRWISVRLKQAGLTADSEALELLAERVEGNLLAAKQEIDKLVLLAVESRVSVETVRASVADGARFDVFQLTDAALAGDRPRAARVLVGLEREGIAAPLVAWSLAREISVVADVVYRMHGGVSADKAMHEAGVWRSKQRLVGTAVRARNTRSVRSLVEQACETDRIVKGARRGQPWNALMDLTMALAGNGRAA